MTGDEHQPQEIIPHIFVTIDFRFWCSQLLLNLKVATDFFILTFEPYIPADQINTMMLCSGHQPGTWFVWNARFGPLFKCRDQCALRKVFCQTDIAHDAGETRDQSGRFDPPDCIDRATEFSIHHRKNERLLSWTRRAIF